MSKFQNNVFNVKGDRNTFGDNSGNTSISNVRITNIRPGGERPVGSTDMPAVLVGAFAVSVLFAWLYLKHFETVHLVLRVGFLTSVVPVLIAIVAAAWQEEGAKLKVAVNGLPVGMLSIAGLFMMTNFNDRISPDLLSFAQQVSAVEMWSRLSADGCRVVLEAEGAVISCALALLVTVLVSLRTLIAQTLSPTNLLSRLTARYSSVFGAALGSLFLALAWGLSSGRAYELWTALQLTQAVAAH
ncbi:hypothetical protein ACKI2N_015610 [Cupriavidus sp. 30B13]|uniref:hypothetical protein n=1 Tax=Cupriavidus sp. 30B13 TaxID=3384241 RepID=UPI003B8FF095